MSACNRLSVAEEVLAESAQNMPQLSYAQRTIAAIRTWLRANVPRLQDLTLADSEIVRSYILSPRGL